MDHQSKVRTCFLIAVFALAVATSPVAAGAEGPVLTVTNVSRISVDVDNQPLNALLRMMAEKRLVNIRGGAAGNESLTLHLANLTLPEMLSKILRGYNYVVIDQGKSQPPLLTVMGRIRQDAAASRAETPAPAEAPALAEPRSYAPPEPPLEPGMPPRQPVARQPQMQQNSQPAGGQTGQIAPPSQPDQAAGSTGAGAKDQGQTGGEAQRQAGQLASGGQPAPQAESPGIHF